MTFSLRASLMKLPRIESLTEGVSAHPTQRQLDKLTQVLQRETLDRWAQTLAAKLKSYLQLSLDWFEKKVIFVCVTKVDQIDTCHIVRPMSEEARQVQPEVLNEDSESCEGGGSDGPIRGQRPGHVTSPDQSEQWRPSSDWIRGWKSRLPLQTIMRMLQV